MSKKEYIDLIIQGLVALGTILLAVIAVYGERVKRWLFRPNLQISVGDTPPYIETIELESKGGTDSITTSVTTTIKVRIFNSGKGSAQSCKSLLQDIFCKRSGSDTFYKQRSLSPTTLSWSNDKYEFSVIPKIPAFFEIARIQKYQPLSQDDSISSSSSSEDSLFISIEEPGKKGLLIHVDKGTFIIPITIFAENIREPVIEYIEIFWNGNDASNLNISNFYVKLLSHGKVPQEVKEKL